MKKILLVFMLMGLLSDIAFAAPTAKPTWDEQFYLCNREAHTIIANPACSGDKCTSVYLAVLNMKRNFVESCMKANGFTVQWEGDKKP